MEGTARRPTVLLVDDHSHVRVLLSAGLKHYGFEVVTACDADDAIERYEEVHGRIDICVTDVDLPPFRVDHSAMNGFELLQRLRSAAPQMNGLLFSGYSDASLRALGVPINRITILRKPCDLLTLASRISDIILTSQNPQTCPSHSLDLRSA